MHKSHHSSAAQKQHIVSADGVRMVGADVCARPEWVAPLLQNDNPEPRHIKAWRAMNSPPNAAPAATATAPLSPSRPSLAGLSLGEECSLPLQEKQALQITSSGEGGSSTLQEKEALYLFGFSGEGGFLFLGERRSREAKVFHRTRTLQPIGRGLWLYPPYSRTARNERRPRSSEGGDHPCSPDVDPESLP